MKQTVVYSIDDIAHIALILKGLLKDCSVITFTGPLGAGKTTLIKQLLQSCGIKDQITSPTFTYVNEYENKTGQRFYHFDLYRLKNAEEFQAAGFDEYLYQPRSWALIEWPEIITPLFTKKVGRISIDYHTSPKERIITIER